MLDVTAEICWFLQETESDKIYQSICNYLSLGQYELAKSLIRVHFERESTDGYRKRVSGLLTSLIQDGPPESWASSDSVPSTAHLLSFCVDFADTMGIKLPQILKRRCEFDLLISLTLMESTVSSFPISIANDLRVRYGSKLLSELEVNRLVIPRMMVRTDKMFYILPGRILLTSSVEKAAVESSLSSEVASSIFDLGRHSIKTGVGLFRLLHGVSPVSSAQLTHIQAALVAEFVVKDWDLCLYHLRFMNELGNSDVLVNSPLINDLISLLVVIVNSEPNKVHQSLISRFISDCLSPPFGSFPFISKKRRPLFGLSIFDDHYSPHPRLRMDLYEALSSTSRDHPRQSLLSILAKLEDSLLQIQSERSPVPPCFGNDELFWDAYYDFSRVANVDPLKYPLESSVLLNRKREFVLANTVLSRFNQLRPVSILICWDDFGIDIDSRSKLLSTCWDSYLSNKKEYPCPLPIENSVWALAYRFHLSLLACGFHQTQKRSLTSDQVWTPVSGESVEIVIDILRHLSCHSFLFVLRATLPGLSSSKLVPSLEDLPPPALAGTSTNISEEVGYDMDILRSYFILREVLYLVTNGSKSKISDSIKKIDSLCSTILNKRIKQSVLSKTMECCFGSSQLSKGTVLSSTYITDIRVLFSIICLVHYHAQTRQSEEILIKLLISLRESYVVLGESCSSSPRSLVEYAGWVGADGWIASKCEEVCSAWSALVLRANTSNFTTPPRQDMSLSPDKFVPRLLRHSLDWVQSALSLNDYVLSEKLVELFGLEKDDSDDSKFFALLRDSLRKSACIPHASDSPSILLDLSISGNSEVSLELLRRGNSLLDEEGCLKNWSSKLLVLLQAKTEFNQTQTRLAEIILEIETLPNEPELLKDHLNRMHTQRSAIMSLVDKVDQARRHGNRSEDDRIEIFLSDAIKSLSNETGIVQGGRSSFLIEFLEYLSKVGSLVQEVSRFTSLFDILSEDPKKLVGRIIFEQQGFNQAVELCELMTFDLIDIVSEQTRNIVLNQELDGQYFISLDLIKKLDSRAIIFCVAKRTERWPSFEMLQYGIDHSVGTPLSRWITERLTNWERFVESFATLEGQDVSTGFSLEEERALSNEYRLALESVSGDSQESVDQLTRQVAKAFLKKKEYISALRAMDEKLSIRDPFLFRESLVGCLNESRDQLSPNEVYELLFRVEDPFELVSLVKSFYPEWEKHLAVKSLELCAERLPKSTEVRHIISVIETMESVVLVTGGKWGNWQRLEKTKDTEECIEVINDLIATNHHSIAGSFLGIKSSVLEGSMDELSDNIELSRLGYIFRNSTGDTSELLNRLRAHHHPLKASRLAMQLIDSIDAIDDRIRLGTFVLSNQIACEEDTEGLETHLASLALLKLTSSSRIRAEWKSLVRRPDLILESLLLNGKTKGIESFLREYGSWRDDELILKLAQRAIGIDPRKSDNKTSNRIHHPDIGLGGEWSLTGGPNDDTIREHHFYKKSPDMPLAMKLLSLLCSDTVENAVRIFEIADKLSFFLYQFVPGIKNTDCPFKSYSLLRQAIVSLLLNIRKRFDLTRFSPLLLQAVSRGIENIDLVADLYLKTGIVVGIKEIVSKQVELSEKLIKMDQLELAKKICFDEAIVIEEMKLLIKVGRFSECRNLMEKSKIETLNSQQILELEDAFKKKPQYSLSDIEKAYKIILCRHLEDQKYGYLGLAEDGGHIELLPKSFRSDLLIEPLVELSTEDTIRTPRRVHTGICTPNEVASSLIWLNELLYYCDKFGEPGSGISVLIRNGEVDEAITRCIAEKLEEKIFIKSISCSPNWKGILNAIRKSNEPMNVLMPYLSSIESHLRQQKIYECLYEYEVSMGRESHAGFVSICLYQQSEDSWEKRIGWLEAAKRHLSCCIISKRFLQKRRRNRILKENISSEEDLSAEEDDLSVSSQLPPISIPFSLIIPDIVTDTMVGAAKTLIELQLEVSRLMPTGVPPSASLFGSIQSVSELIDYLLMNGHVSLSKTIVSKIKLPDSALCGIF